jgi:hypothetical protein
MVRVLLIATAIAFVLGILPASAQGGGGCEAWCRANRCNGGNMSANAPRCMIGCVAACQKKSKK